MHHAGAGAAGAAAAAAAAAGPRAAGRARGPAVSAPLWSLRGERLTWRCQECGTWACGRSCGEVCWVFLCLLKGDTEGSALGHWEPR